MKRNLSLVALYFLGLSSISVNAAEAVCHHCEDIREYNAAHHQNFEYYEDYLKSNPSKDISTTARAKSPVAERNVLKPASNVTGTTSTDSSGINTIPTTSTPSTGVSAPQPPAVNQAPQDGTAPKSPQI